MQSDPIPKVASLSSFLRYESLALNNSGSATNSHGAQMQGREGMRADDGRRERGRARRGASGGQLAGDGDLISPESGRAPRFKIG